MDTVSRNDRCFKRNCNGDTGVRTCAGDGIFHEHFIANTLPSLKEFFQVSKVI